MLDPGSWMLVEERGFLKIDSFFPGSRIKDPASARVS
jgi:hypothetical protein